MSEFRPEEGIFDLDDVRIAVIAARWNAEVTDGLLAGAVRALGRHKIDGNAVEVYRVPGALSCLWPRNRLHVRAVLMQLLPLVVLFVETLRILIMFALRLQEVLER